MMMVRMVSLTGRPRGAAGGGRVPLQSSPVSATRRPLQGRAARLPAPGGTFPRRSPPARPCPPGVSPPPGPGLPSRLRRSNCCPCGQLHPVCRQQLSVRATVGPQASRPADARGPRSIPGTRLGWPRPAVLPAPARGSGSPGLVARACCPHPAAAIAGGTVARADICTRCAGNSCPYG